MLRSTQHDMAPALYNGKVDAARIPHKYACKTLDRRVCGMVHCIKKKFYGLLALLPLTKDGAKPAVVDTMIDDLQSQAEGEVQRDMLSIGLTFASLVFKKQDQDWLTRRISMLEDILQESPFYQRILHQGEEKGLKEGMEKGMEKGKVQALQQALVDIVQARFPQEAVLIRLAKGQVAIIEDAEVLQRLVVRVGVLRTVDEIQHFLLYYDME